MKRIYIITHGLCEDGANPKMSQKGIAQMLSLKDKLPSSPAKIICGTGQRHIQTAKILRLVIEQYTDLVGTPDRVIKKSDKKIIMLADGAVIDYEKHTSLKDMQPVARPFIGSLPDNTLICAGRQLPVMLGITKDEVKSAAVYEVQLVAEENGHNYKITINLLAVAE